MSKAASSATNSPNKSSLIDVTLARIRDTIKRRSGSAGIRSLGRIFRILDSDGSKILSPEEFGIGMQEMGITLSPAELREVVAAFDREGDGGVSFDEFLRCIRGEMSEARKQWVRKAFDKMSNDHQTITLEDIKRVYHAAGSADVKSGKKTEIEVLREFLSNFGNSADGNVTYEEFEDHYAGISCSIDEDIAFITMMMSSWKF
eukprot:gnl/Hemi2/5903_TR2046_c0_g1_i1.p1 gnl/Hemi2/5903_TR2046_c0_g1~~gnl/Hemi2/5903_TR2046_c0_g1_i1.p1  ORF type:complete len:230 (+),score=110.07 gnl/Hemi2/5903_TR2046_c0_g1_i1:82-690(+)